MKIQKKNSGLKLGGFLPVLTAVFLLVLCIIITSVLNNYENSENEISKAVSENVLKNNSEDNSENNLENKKNEKSEEMRGIWIPYMTLDMSNTDRTEKTFTSKINTILDNCKKYKANTIIVHVRPFCDSIYPSEYFPSSHIISGKQGVNSDYDPLEIIINLAKEKGLKVHAWVNPLRIKLSESNFNLAENNPCLIWQNDDDKSNDSYIMTYKNGIYLNPAYPETRKLIIDGIREIVKNYDVDGIQLDDYFYPSEEKDYDKSSYEQYKSSLSSGSIPMTQEEWRTANINSLVSGIYSAVHSENENCLFGIAPECNTDNDIKAGADVFSWGNTYGYVDYICPQIYVSNNHQTAPFQELADKWKKIVSNSNVKLYLGLAVYKAGTDADNGTWLENNESSNIIASQIEYSRKIKTDGFMLYSYDYLIGENAAEEVKNAAAVI